MATKLLIESVDTEIDRKDGKMHLTGPFMMFGKKNLNGRVYPEKVMDAAVSVYQKKYIDERRSIGELLHPETIVPNPERACILVTELRKEKPFYMGKAKVLTHVPLGKLVEGLYLDGVRLGGSSRGAGTVDKSGFVNSDFVITSAMDIVFDPSVSAAFVEAVMESRDYIFESGSWRLAEAIQKRIHKTPSKQLMEAKVIAFREFLNSI